MLVVFSKKQVEKLPPFAILACGNKSLSYKPNCATQHICVCCMANSVDPDQPASEEDG